MRPSVVTDAFHLRSPDSRTVVRGIHAYLVNTSAPYIDTEIYRACVLLVDHLDGSLVDAEGYRVIERMGWTAEIHACVPREDDSCGHQPNVD